MIWNSGGERTVLRAPAAVLARPEHRPCGLQLEGQGGWRGLIFTVMHCPRVGDDHAGAGWRKIDAHAPEPTARQVFGGDLPTVLTGAEAGPAIRLMRDLGASWYRGPFEHLAANARLGLWLAELVRASPPMPDPSEVRRRYFTEPDAPRRSDDDWLAMAEATARRLADTGLSVGGLATALGVSRQWLTRRLRRATGGDARAWLDGIRLSRAQAWLVASDLPIVAIAKRSGFRSTAAFARWFRRQADVPPTVWRRRQVRPG